MKTETNNGEFSHFYITVASNIRRLRQERGVSQLELAVELGHSSPAFVARAERMREGKHFNLEHIYHISKVLDVALCDIFEEPKQT